MITSPAKAIDRINDMSSTKRKARIAGLLYLLLALTGVFFIIYVPTTVF